MSVSFGFAQILRSIDKNPFNWEKCCAALDVFHLVFSKYCAALTKKRSNETNTAQH
jgi:hypothetical protein